MIKNAPITHDNDLDPVPPITIELGGERTVSSQSAPAEDQDLIDTTQAIGNFDFSPASNTVDQQLSTVSVDVAQESTRAKIALTFTYIFLALVAAALFLPFITNMVSPQTFDNPVETAKNLVTLLASVLAGPFGFIVGFYFKQTS